MAKKEKEDKKKWRSEKEKKKKEEKQRKRSKKERGKKTEREYRKKECDVMLHKSLQLYSPPLNL